MDEAIALLTVVARDIEGLAGPRLESGVGLVPAAAEGGADRVDASLAQLLAGVRAGRAIIADSSGETVADRLAAIALPETWDSRDRVQRERIAADRAGWPDATDWADGLATTDLVLEYDRTEYGGDGSAVIAVGATGDDGNAAESVAVLVPGVGSTAFDLTLDDARDVAAAAPGTLAIAWLDYDAPSGMDTVLAASPRAAERGAVELRRDLASMAGAADRLAGDPELTVIGHSYGSTTLAYAAQDGALVEVVDQLVLLGSPGAGPVEHAAEFGLPAYVAAAPDDPITHLGGIGAVPSGGGLFGLDSLSWDGSLFGLGLGTDPAMESFGATRIPADHAGVDGSAHSSYTEPGSAALRALAGLLAGDPNVPTVGGRIVESRWGVAHRTEPG